jgi:hypothetical protein
MGLRSGLTLLVKGLDWHNKELAPRALEIMAFFRKINIMWVEELQKLLLEARY